MNARRTALTAGVLALAGFTSGCPTTNDGNGGGGGGGGSDSGSLVAEFGGGVLLSDPSGGNDEALAVAADAESFYVAGTKRGTGTSSEVYWRIEKRALLDGSLEDSAESDPSGFEDEPRAVALDATHLYVAGTANGTWYVEKRGLSNLDLDPSFGTAGVVTGVSGSLSEGPRALAIDGTHMYLVGTASSTWRMEKRDLDSGDLESTTFGGGAGFVTSDPSGLSDEAFAVAIDDAHMYVAGTAGQAWRVEKRSLSTGDLETTTFGGATGAVAGAGAGLGDRAVALALDATHLYVAGYETTGLFDRRWRVEKRDLATGNLDTGTFGGATGFVTSDPGAGPDEPAAMVVEPGDAATSFFVLGTDASGASARWRMEKRSFATGDLDPDFGTAGVESEDPSPGEDRPLAMATTPEHFIAVGFDSTPGNRQWRIEGRSLADGTHGLFGNAGFVTSDVSEFSSRPISIAVDSTYMYVLGKRDASSISEWRRLEKRRLSDGGLVGAIEMTGDPWEEIRIDDTSLYLFAPEDDWRIGKRSLSDLAFDVGFGVGGVMSGDPDMTMYSWAVDGGYAYVGGGYDEISAIGTWRFEKRDLSDGAFDAGFGVSGVITTGHFDRATAVAVDSTFLYAAAGFTGFTRLEKRSLSNGAPVAAFGTGGAVTDDPALQFRPEVVSVDSSGIYSAGPLLDDPDNLIVTKRSLDDGRLLPAFGGNGVVTILDFDQSVTRHRGVAVHASSLYIAGSQEGVWRIEKRRTSDGRLDRGFGTAGVIVGDSSFHGGATTLAARSEFLYVAGTQDTADSVFPVWRIEKRRL